VSKKEEKVFLIFVDEVGTFGGIITFGYHIHFSHCTLYGITFANHRAKHTIATKK